MFLRDDGSLREENGQTEIQVCIIVTISTKHTLIT